MITGICYFFIIFLANTVGAVSGMGGGVIIKPCLDFLALSPLSAINFYASFAVFIMAIVSTGKQIKNGIHLKIKAALLLSAGSIMGGQLGDASFRLLIRHLPSNWVNLIQIALTIVTLLIALVFSKERLSPKRSWSHYVVSGVFLGALATLLGIGGGPINVALLLSLFGMSIKEATVYSIVIIFFSQLSKLATSITHLAADHVVLNLLPFIFAAALVGGFLGAVLNKRLASPLVLQLYKLIVVLVILLNVFNGVALFF